MMMIGKKEKCNCGGTLEFTKFKNSDCDYLKCNKCGQGFMKLRGQNGNLLNQSTPKQRNKEEKI